MDTGSILIQRGKTYYGLAGTIPASYVGSVGLEGTPQVLKDLSATTGMQRSQSDVHSIVVRNVSGGTLYAGMIVSWASGYRGKRVDGRTCVTAQEWAGVVDDCLGTAGVRDGDLFNLIVRGPCLVLLSRTAAEAVISVDDILYAVTAATSGATTAGRFVKWLGTFSAAQTTDGTAGSIIMNRLGRAMSAATTADTGALRLVDLGR